MNNIFSQNCEKTWVAWKWSSTIQSFQGIKDQENVTRICNEERLQTKCEVLRKKLTQAHVQNEADGNKLFHIFMKQKRELKEKMEDLKTSSCSEQGKTAPKYLGANFLQEVLQPFILDSEETQQLLLEIQDLKVLLS